MFSCEFCQIFKYTFSKRTLFVAVSDNNPQRVCTKQSMPLIYIYVNQSTSSGLVWVCMKKPLKIMQLSIINCDMFYSSGGEIKSHELNSSYSEMLFRKVSLTSKTSAKNLKKWNSMQPKAEDFGSQ